MRIGRCPIFPVPRRLTMITAVLPLTTKDAGRARILFKSLAKFFDPDLLAHVLVVVPDIQAQEIGESISQCGLRHRVVNESEICGDVAGVGGWYVQQIAKLGAWRFVDTPFYLTLDSDVICTRHTSYADLVRNNLGRQHREPRVVHAQWWKRSARLLGVRASLSADGMGVTPLLYAAEVTRQLTVELDRLHGSWLGVLKSNHLWAEHALYDLYLSKQRAWGNFHFAGQLYGPGVWHRAGLRPLGHRRHLLTHRPLALRRVPEQHGNPGRRGLGKGRAVSGVVESVRIRCRYSAYRG